LSKKIQPIVWQHFKDFEFLRLCWRLQSLYYYLVFWKGVYSEWIFISFYSILLLAFYKLKNSLLKKKGKQAGEKDGCLKK
jgi:hypothetical protein